ncbi:glucan endo-1,3-beta-glucosidase 7-like [Vicia villosa]|uniref:glucan endo-1,3-beta-glucosidase 7-like n=1 Tax=Vicia villosa TaxID=3911 RepID=UPI00273B0CE8|nr:glucan endo-1,3-beta-glucosidase 7-like [Vicia villosa]
MNTTKLREKKKRIIEKLLAAMSSSIGSILTMVLLVLVLAAGITLKFGNGQDQEPHWFKFDKEAKTDERVPKGGIVISGKSWCIVSPSLTEEQQNVVLDMICVRYYCAPVYYGGECLEPNNIYNHASVVLSKHYITLGSDLSICNAFGGIVVITDPSYGNCDYGLGWHK